ncbi:hypothetical protein LWI28_026463 [Acer negundo]|uniref:Uncharacterized protein n=1 Tax=Acer negundo TaxID=4023 RepID=A0AAD5NT57_ACENE|nr:hypothetical protein LWI28_026463 [Acer negundo]
MRRFCGSPGDIKCHSVDGVLYEYGPEKSEERRGSLVLAKMLRGIEDDRWKSKHELNQSELPQLLEFWNIFLSFSLLPTLHRTTLGTELGFDDEDEDYEAVSDGSKLDTVLSMVKEIKEWTEMLHKRMDLFEAELRHYRDDVADIRKELRLRSYHRSRPASSA